MYSKADRSKDVHI